MSGGVVVFFSFLSSFFTQLFLLFCFHSLGAQKHKERDRHKPKHKKTMDMSPSLVLPNIMVPDKVRGFNLGIFFLICHSSGYPPDLPHILCPLLLHWRYFDNHPLFVFPSLPLSSCPPFPFDFNPVPPPLLLFCLFTTRPTTAAAQVGASPLCQPPRRSAWTTVPPASPTPTFRKCRPLTLAAAPKTGWRRTPGRRRPRRRTRRAAAEATRWDKGAAASLSPPQGSRFPPPWSPWQPPPHLPLLPLGLSTKVN